MGKSYKRVAALKKGLDILEYLADQKEPVSGNIIATAINMPYDTAMCHLATLGDAQFIRQIGEKFELGPKNSFIWARYRARLGSKISALTHEYTKLEVCNG